MHSPTTRSSGACANRCGGVGYLNTCLPRVLTKQCPVNTCLAGLSGDSSWMALIYTTSENGFWRKRVQHSTKTFTTTMKLAQTWRAIRASRSEALWTQIRERKQVKWTRASKAHSACTGWVAIAMRASFTGAANSTGKAVLCSQLSACTSVLFYTIRHNILGVLSSYTHLLIY